MRPNKLIALLTAIAAAGNAGMTTITAAETTPPAGTLYGDANLDGKITVADAVAVLQFIANQTKYALEDQGRINADVIDAGEGITGLDAKEKHGMRYTLVRGLSQVRKWVRLKFASMNIKKYALHMA